LQEVAVGIERISARKSAETKRQVAPLLARGQGGIEKNRLSAAFDITLE